MERISPTPPLPPSLRKMQDGEIYLCSFADHGRGGDRVIDRLGRKKLVFGKYPEKNTQ